MSLRRLLYEKAQRNSGEVRAALYLSKCLLLWPRDIGRDEVLEKPSQAAASSFSADALDRLTPEERAEWLRIYDKARGGAQF